MLTKRIVPPPSYSSLNCCFSYKRLIRLTAYLLKWRQYKREERTDMRVTAFDMDAAEERLIKLEQQREFSKEMRILLRNGELPSKSWLLKHNPFVDNNMILRVGGRLQNSSEPFATKHPIVLPKSGLIMKMAFDLHHKHYHMPRNTIENTIRTKYFSNNLPDIVKKITESCVKCKRFTRKQSSQLMAPLPACRRPSYTYWVSSASRM